MLLIPLKLIGERRWIFCISWREGWDLSSYLKILGIGDKINNH